MTAPAYGLSFSGANTISEALKARGYDAKVVVMIGRYAVDYKVPGAMRYEQIYTWVEWERKGRTLGQLPQPEPIATTPANDSTSMIHTPTERQIARTRAYLADGLARNIQDDLDWINPTRIARDLGTKRVDLARAEAHLVALLPLDPTPGQS